MDLVGLLSGAGSLISGFLGYKAQKDTNETNINLGREQMAFQKEMSSTAYQRGVKDMQAAGLNPMLAYSQGGASSPMGSMPQVQNAVATGMSTAQQSAQVMNGIAQVVATLAQTEKTQAEAEMTRRQTLPAELYPQTGYANLYRIHEDTRRLASGATLDDARAESEYVIKRIREAEEKYLTQSLKDRVDLTKSEASLKRLDVPRMRAEEKFYESLGQANPWVKMFVMLMQGLKGVTK